MTFRSKHLSDAEIELAIADAKALVKLVATSPWVLGAVDAGMATRVAEALVQVAADFKAAPRMLEDVAKSEAAQLRAAGVNECVRYGSVAPDGYDYDWCFVVHRRV